MMIGDDGDDGDDDDGDNDCDDDGDGDDDNGDNDCDNDDDDDDNDDEVSRYGVQGRKAMGPGGAIMPWGTLLQKPFRPWGRVDTFIYSSEQHFSNHGLKTNMAIAMADGCRMSS